MTSFKRLSLMLLAVGVLMLTLSACRSGNGMMSADRGLVPDQASTGNPPLIPHEVAADDGGAECLGCHKDGVDAPAMPAWHATLTDCRQCHVPLVQSDAVFKPQY